MNLLRGLVHRFRRTLPPIQEVPAQPVITQPQLRAVTPAPVAAENAQTKYLLDSPWTETSLHIPKQPEFKDISSRPCSVCAPAPQIKTTATPFVFTSDFMELLQVAISERHCYPRPERDPHRPDHYYRHLHGAQHGSRKIIWMLSLLALLRRHGDKTAQEFPEEYLRAVIIANLLNGSGRTQDRGVEPAEDKAISAEHAYSTLLNLGTCPKLAAICRDAIIHKDASDPGKTEPNPFMERYGDNPSAVMLFNLLHDSHLLDFARVSKGRFDLNYMAYYRTGKGQPGLLKDLEHLQLRVFEALQGQQDIFDSCDLVHPDTGEKVTFTANYDGQAQAKKPLEFAGNTLYAQYRWFCENQPETVKLVEEVAQFQPVRPTFNNTTLVQTSAPKGLGSYSRLEGTYVQPETKQKFYLKQPDTPERTRNEKLSLSLASLMELQTPNMEWVERRSEAPMLVSEWMENLDRADTAKERLQVLQKASPQQRARLLLVNCLLGNGDCISDRIDNSFVLDDGSITTLDWGVSGQHAFPSPTWPTPQNHQQFDRRLPSAMPEYLYQLNCKHPALQRIMRPFRYVTLDQTPQVFKGISEADLDKEVEKLLNIPEESINHLIELYGPKKPVERLWLRQAVHERRAWLALYHPEVCRQHTVMPAEQAAINASGSRGFCLPCSNMDIEQGEMRVLQKTRADGTPITQLQLRLTPEAAQTLEENLGYGPDITRINDRIHWLNSLRNSQLTESKKRELLDDIKSLIVLCESYQLQLKADKHRWEPPVYDEPLKPAQSRWRQPDHSKEFQQCIAELEASTEKLSSVLKAVANLPSEATPLEFAKLSAIKPLPDGLPARVSSISTDKQNTLSYCPGTPHHNRMQLEAVATEITDSQKKVPIHTLRCSLEGSQQGSPDIELTFFRAGQPYARSLSRVVTLETDGHDSNTTGALVNKLSSLGINTRRPSRDELQADYLQQLANANGVLHQMHASPEVRKLHDDWLATCNKGEPDISLLQPLNRAREAYLCQQLKLDSQHGIQWAMHTTLEAGCRVYYAPPLPLWHGSEQP